MGLVAVRIGSFAFHGPQPARCGRAALWVIEHLEDLVCSWSDWRAVHNRRGQLGDVLALRTDLVQTVHATSAVID